MDGNGEPPVIRVVLDTSVIAAAFRSRMGASNQLLRRAIARQFTALASHALFLEYEAVIKRPEQRLANALTLPQLDDLLSELAAVLEGVDIHFAWRPQTPDPGDDLVLEAAINGRAEAVVTHNVRDFAAAARFGIAVLRPGEFLARIGA